MELNEIKNLGESDLIQRVDLLKKDLFDMRQQRQMGKMEKPARFRTIRKEIARIMTIIKERKI